jgi:hypothetical protein
MPGTGAIGHGQRAGMVGRTAQYLSGVYLAVAAYAAARESGAWEVSLCAQPRDWRLSYALAVVFVATSVVRFLLSPGLGERAVPVGIGSCLCARYPQAMRHRLARNL